MFVTVLRPKEMSDKVIQEDSKTLKFVCDYFESHEKCEKDVSNCWLEQYIICSYPLAPDKLEIKKMLSDYQLKITDDFNISINNVKKLVRNFCNKQHASLKK